MSSALTKTNPHGFRFCPKCGSGLNYINIDNRERLMCGACGFIFYQNPVPAVGALLLEETKVLLVKRKFEPAAGDWCLPSGFLEYGESLEEGLKREVREETNLTIDSPELFFACSAQDDPRHHVVLIIYKAKILGGDLCPGDDAIDAKFFDLTRLPGNIAFSCHRQALAKLIKNEAT